MKLLKNVLMCVLIVCTGQVWAATRPPDIKLPTRNGEFSLAEHRGEVVYLDFWASWCQPCRKSFPWMNEMRGKYRNRGLTIIAVNLDKEKTLAMEFLRKIRADFTIAFDPSGDSARAFGLRGMPTSYLIGRDGGLEASHIGFRERDKAPMEQAILKLLDQTGAD